MQLSQIHRAGKISNVPMTVKCNLFLNADDTCLVFLSKNVKDIEKQLKLVSANFYCFTKDSLSKTMTNAFYLI